MKSSYFSHISSLVLTFFLFSGLGAAKVSPTFVRKQENKIIHINKSDLDKLAGKTVTGTKSRATRSVVQTLLDFHGSNKDLFVAFLEFYNNCKVSGTVENVVLPAEMLARLRASEEISDILLTDNGCIKPTIIETIDLVWDMINNGVEIVKKEKCSKACWLGCFTTCCTKEVPQLLLLSVDPAIKIFEIVMQAVSKQTYITNDISINARVDIIEQ